MLFLGSSWDCKARSLKQVQDEQHGTVSSSRPLLLSKPHFHHTAEYTVSISKEVNWLRLAVEKRASPLALQVKHTGLSAEALGLSW